MEEKLYKLDWTETEIKTGQGRFSHFLGKPTPETILERDKKLPRETPVSRGGSRSLTQDESVQDAVDAEYYDKVKTRDATGYPGEVPELHKANAFRALYTRWFFLAEDADIFGDEIEIHEIVGKDPDNPDYVIPHFIKQPSEKDFRSMRAAINNNKLEPAGNGKQKIVYSSYLQKAMTFYRTYIAKVEGATVQDKKWGEIDKEIFLDQVDPLFQRRIVEVLIEEIHAAASD